jgi:dephospho-CoA kinase
MMQTRGYTREQAEARLAAQMPVAEKADLSDWTIHNDSTVEELKAEVQRCVAWLVSRMEKAT